MPLSFFCLVVSPIMSFLLFYFVFNLMSFLRSCGFFYGVASSFVLDVVFKLDYYFFLPLAVAIVMRSFRFFFVLDTCCSLLPLASMAFLEFTIDASFCALLSFLSVMSFGSFCWSFSFFQFFFFNL